MPKSVKLPEERQKQLAEFQQKFIEIYKFSDITSVDCLLNQCLTHSHYRGEGGAPLPNYERLEWIGDRIFSVILSEHIFTSNPDLDEGRMTIMRTKLESNALLKSIALDKLKIDKYMRSGQGFRGEEFSKWGDLVEALIGAIYLDAKKRNQKWEPIVRQFMSKYWFDPQTKQAITFKAI